MVCVAGAKVGNELEKSDQIIQACMPYEDTTLRQVKDSWWDSRETVKGL